MGKARYERAEGQDDGKLCWAASMAWWTRVTPRADRDQVWVQEEFSFIWENNNGVLNDSGMQTLLSFTEFRMYYESFTLASQLTADVVRRYLNYGPVVLAFYDRNISSPHVNCIYDIDERGSNPRLAVMEPRFSVKSDGFGWEGKHVQRHLSYYQAQGPLQTWIGCPKP